MFNIREIEESYRTAHRLAVEIHRMASVLPLFGGNDERRQLRKASQAVTVNLAQALWHRGREPMHLRFVVYAHTACDGMIERLRLVRETRALKQEDWIEYFLEEYGKLKARLEKLLINGEACLKN